MDGKRITETHLLRFLSHLRCRDDPGMGSVLSAPHKLGLGQLLSAVLLHGLGLQLGDAGVLGPEDLGRVGLLCHLGGGWFLVLMGVSLCRGRRQRISVRGEMQVGGWAEIGDSPVWMGKAKSILCGWAFVPPGLLELGWILTWETGMGIGQSSGSRLAGWWWGPSSCRGGDLREPDMWGLEGSRAGGRVGGPGTPSWLCAPGPGRQEHNSAPGQERLTAGWGWSSYI